MEKEDIDTLLDFASRSRIYAAVVGTLMLIIGVVFVLLGAHAIVLEITVTGIMMMVFGINTILTEGMRNREGLTMIVLGALFVILVYLFEALHGLMLFFEFLSTGLVSLGVAFGRGESAYGRKASLIFGIVSIYVAINLLIAHEESLDILITLMGYVILALSAYVLYCAINNERVVNPLPEEKE